MIILLAVILLFAYLSGVFRLISRHPLDVVRNFAAILIGTVAVLGILLVLTFVNLLL